MAIRPYLFFDGRCEEAIEFYKTALGAHVEMMMRFNESPVPANPEMCLPGTEDKIMHAALRIGDGTVMMSDGMAKGQPKFEGFSLALSPTNQAETQRIFGALAEGGEVQLPLSKTFFSDSFGMVKDRFGVGWMVMLEKK